MIKKAALGLTLALTMSTVIACGPNGNQGMNGAGTSTYGTTNYGTTTKYYQDGTVNRNWQGNRTGALGTEGYPIGRNGTTNYGTNQSYSGNYGSTVNNQRGYGTMNGYRDGRVAGTQDGFFDGANDRSGIFGTRDGLRSGNRGTMFNNFNQDRNGFFGAGYDTNRNLDGWQYNYGWGQGLGRNMGYNQGLNNGTAGFGTGMGLGLNGTTNQHAGIYDESASRKIEQRLNKLAGVTGSSVVVTDKAVFVGVDTDRTGAQGNNNGQRGMGTAGNQGQNDLFQKIRAEVQAEASGKQIIIFSDNGQDLNNGNNKVGTQNRTGTTGAKNKSR